MNLQKAALADLPVLCGLYEQYYAYYAGQQPQYYQAAAARPEYYEGALQSDGEAFFLAFDGDAPIGFCHVAEKQSPPIEFYVPRRFGVLMELFVAASHRGSGADTLLLGRAKEWAVQRDLGYLELRVLQMGDFFRSFYQREGFSVAAHTIRFQVG